MKFMKCVSTLASSIALSSLLVCSASAANENREFNGTLKIGKQYSYIFYFGKQTGDTVVYFFDTDSAVGKNILSRCKNNSPCSGSGALKAVTEAPQGIPETTSGRYRITAIATDADYQIEVKNNTICSFINANSVNIRQKPDLTAPVILQLNRGDGVRATSRTGTWVKIAARDSGKPPTPYTPLEGYVSIKYINGCSEDQFDRWRK
jgi:Bacterial SH3 domain